MWVERQDWRFMDERSLGSLEATLGCSAVLPTHLDMLRVLWRETLEFPGKQDAPERETNLGEA